MTPAALLSRQPIGLCLLLLSVLVSTLANFICLTFAGRRSLPMVYDSASLREELRSGRYRIVGRPAGLQNLFYSNSESG